MGVMLQAFCWDCPKVENREYQWWPFIESRLTLIAQAGFTALWLLAGKQSGRMEIDGLRSLRLL
jgi:alpha-amylase